MMSGAYHAPCQITKLDLSRNNITANGTTDLYKGLGMNVSVKSLNLEKNEWGPLGFIGIQQFLHHN
jgi:hypothetical protein